MFHFDRWGIRYGVDDKGQAAAFVLSVLLIALMGFALLLGVVVERSWFGDVFKVLATALTFTVGVAIGKSGR